MQTGSGKFGVHKIGTVVEGKNHYIITTPVRGWIAERYNGELGKINVTVSKVVLYDTYLEIDIFCDQKTREDCRKYIEENSDIQITAIE